MIKSQKHVLQQQTNEAVVNIRVTELNYYSGIFQSFGGISAVLIGFNWTGLTQMDVNQHLHLLCE